MHNRRSHIKKRLFEHYGLKASNSDVALINDNIMSGFATYLGSDNLEKRITYYIVPFMNDAVGIVYDSLCKYPLTCVTIEQIVSQDEHTTLRKIERHEW